MKKQLSPGRQEKPSRETENTLYSIQAYRGIAVLLVVLFHANAVVRDRYDIPPFHGFFSFGFSGVYLFFVLSGFIILFAHFRDIDCPKRVLFYISRRFIRIYPFYWVVFLIWGSYPLITGRLGMEDFLLNAFLFTSGTADLVIQTSWTLYYEAMFYLFFIVLVLSKRIGIIVIFLWSVLLLFQLVNKNIHYSVLYPLNLFFIFGLATSTLTLSLNAGKVNKHQKEILSIISILLGVILFAITAIYWSTTDVKDWTTDPLVIIGFGSASSFLLIASMSNTIENFFMRQKLLGLLGNASYSIYLVHLQIEKIAINIKTVSDWIWSVHNQFIADFLFIFVAFVAILVGIFFYKKIERPLLLFLRGKVACLG